MLMPHRSYASTANYRFGFNGKENDNEPKGLGNEQDYGMRIYDDRLGKFLSVDPISIDYPWLTPYQFASNRPIDGIDQDGLEWVPGFPLTNWVYEKYLEYKYGDPTGSKTLVSGSLQLAAVESKQMNYQNNANIPANIQNKLDNYNSLQAYSRMAEGSYQMASWTLETGGEIISTVMPIDELFLMSGKAIGKSWTIIFKKEALEIEQEAFQHTLSSKAREFYRSKQISKALDQHYEDLVRYETGGVQKIIGEREFDAVTDKAIIQAKRSIAAVENPKNFLSKKVRNQIKKTIELAKEQKKEAQFWFKYGVHPEVRKYIEQKGGKVITGLNK